MKLRLPRLPAPPIVPSRRALAALALLAVLATLIGATAPSAWIIAPAAAAAVLLAVLVDGWLAGRLLALDAQVPAQAEIGQPVMLRLAASIARPAGALPPEAALSFDSRLGAGGAARFTLAPTGQQHGFAGATALVPTRRGTGMVADLWLRWRGPLGLGWRQTQRRLDRPVAVWPDLAPLRSPVLQAFFRDAQFGIVARRIRGEGTQFEALTEYQPGMDRRRIDWRASARHTRLLARENEAERDNQIVLAIDCGQAMSEPVDGLPRLDRAITAALTTAWVALKGGDRVALFGFAARPLALTEFVTSTRAFTHLQQAAAGLDYHAREPNFTLALATLATRLKRRSLIVLFTEVTDLTSAEMMLENIERLVRHHVVLFVTLADTELATLSASEPDALGDIAVAITADALARQRALVLARLRHLGVEVIEASHEALGLRLIDHYLAAKRAEAIG